MSTCPSFRLFPLFYELLFIAGRRLAMKPEIAQRISFHLRWYYESKSSNSPNSEILEKVTRDQFHQILKDAFGLRAKCIDCHTIAVPDRVGQPGFR